MLDAFVFEPFSINEQLIDSLILEPDQFEVWVSSVAGEEENPSGSIIDPFDGSTQIKFDEVMAGLRPWTTVHLGPGEFSSKGFVEGVSGGWQPKWGQRIVGAGIDVTVLRLVSPSSSTNLTRAIGAPRTNFLDGFEVSDLTIDCNQPDDDVACGAIAVSGTHVHVRNVRAINFGTQTVAVKGAVILIGNPDPSTPEAFDCVIDSCIVERPALNNVRETTCLGFGGTEDANGVMAYHRGCVIRNCFVDCEYVTNAVAISSLTVASGDVTVDTSPFVHGLTGTPWVVVTGALNTDVLSLQCNGSFQVDVLTNTTFAYSLNETPSFSATGDMSIGKFSSQRIDLGSLAKNGTGPYALTLITVTPHFRIPGQNVVVNKVAGEEDDGNNFSLFRNLRGIFHWVKWRSDPGFEPPQVILHQ